MNVISCADLTKRFGSNVAVSGLDLEVGAGQVYGFLGPNGAGKTTTIRMLLGLIAPTSGQIRLLDRPLPDPRAVRLTGSMIEEPAFYPWLTGSQNLQVSAWARRQQRSRRCQPGTGRHRPERGRWPQGSHLLPGNAPAARPSRRDARSPAADDH
jgi:ABC-type multidrug transport system ATPase subunit